MAPFRTPNTATWSARYAAYSPWLAGVGLVWLLVVGLSFVRLLCSLFLLPGRSLRNYGPKGSWAVVSGASEGIGREFALQLAQKGINVMLIARTESKLRELAQEIDRKFAQLDVQTRVFAMDFARNDDDDYARLKSMLDSLDVAILVNNVGRSHNIPVPFIETPEAEMMDIMMINCLGTLRLTRLAAPGMVERKRGLIITMGSFGGLLPTPLLATYSGSKAFLQQWSSALGSELKPHGVDVELVLSYLVTSAMSKIRRTSLLIPNPRDFVKAALGRSGRSGGAQSLPFTSTPYWTHALIHWVLSWAGAANGVILKYNRKMHEDIRRRALRKAAGEGKKSS